MRLIGASEALSESLGIGAVRFNKAPVERWLAKCRGELTQVEVETYLAEGRDLSTEAAIEYALTV
jgi:hypothetical protein